MSQQNPPVQVAGLEVQWGLDTVVWKKDIRDQRGSSLPTDMYMFVLSLPLENTGKYTDIF